MAEHPELEAAIFAAPDELAGYERYGRWLEEQGDPRAALILGQCARERDGASQTGLDGWDRQSAELVAMLTLERISMTGERDPLAARVRGAHRSRDLATAHR